MWHYFFTLSYSITYSNIADSYFAITQSIFASVLSKSDISLFIIINIYFDYPFLIEPFLIFINFTFTSSTFISDISFNFIKAFFWSLTRFSITSLIQILIMPKV